MPGPVPGIPVLRTDRVQTHSPVMPGPCRRRTADVNIGVHGISMIGRPKLVLASGSPRRVTLINQIGIEPDGLRPANIDETPRRGELPRACANRLARAK